MESNRLQNELERVRETDSSSLIDLSDTSFHANGLRFPDEILASSMLDYLRHRSYRPDPKGSLAARGAIASYYRRSGVEIPTGRIIITASTSESYSLLFSSLAEAGDNVVLPAPTYPLFEYLAEFARLEARYYTMRFEEGFRIDTEEIANRIDSRTRFVVLISPSNPTGRVATGEEVGALLDLCERTGSMLVTDEVFSEFLYDGRAGHLPRPAAARSTVPVFTLNGISKMFASPDLKLAWIAATGREDVVDHLVDRLELANDTFLSCSSLTQHILPDLFDRGGEMQQDMVGRLSENRRLLLEALTDGHPGRDELPVRPPGRPVECVRGIRLVVPEGGIHCVLGIPRAAGVRWNDDEDFAVRLLEERRVYLHPGYFYGLEERAEEIYVVISFLKEPKLLVDGLRRLLSFV